MTQSDQIVDMLAAIDCRQRQTEPMTDPSAAEFARFVAEAQEQRARADALAVALSERRAAWQGIRWMAERYAEGGGNFGIEVTDFLAADAILATDPDQRGAAILAAAIALAKAADRVARGEGTLQRYEYLGEALEAWDQIWGSGSHAAGEGE